MLAGGLIRAIQGLVAASPTLIVGLFIAAVLRFYLGPQGTLRLFGGNSIRSLPQSWAVGMLLPVCSIGVIPIIREMRRMGIRPGAITAFALAAPLFNPLSLLYGLTLSRPYVIVGFAAASLAVVTILGIAWDRSSRWLGTKDPEEGASSDSETGEPDEGSPIGLPRLGACAVFMGRELYGPTGYLSLIVVAGLFLLGFSLPHGALQSAVEQLDPWAPLKMAVVAVPVYATPMLTMSQLGMMFAHGNSPGAAFCLLLLGTGMNLATIWWIAQNFGARPTAVWLATLLSVVLGLAHAVDRPLIPPGVEPAGHTHAFDIYTNPYTSGTQVSVTRFQEELRKTSGVFDLIGAAVAFFILLAGLAFRTLAAAPIDAWLQRASMNKTSAEDATGLGQHVSSRTVGLTCLGGLVAFSVVGCYAFYPAPSEVLEEMRMARTEVLSGVTSRDHERTLHWIPILEEWSRKLEVGYALRNFELRPYQQMQCYLLRKKLELLEHAVEHASVASSDQHSHDEHDDQHHSEDSQLELETMDELRSEITQNATRLSSAFRL